MKITIDTKQDSHEDIKTVMRILNHVLDGKDSVSSYSNTESKPEPADTSNLMSMFANSGPAKKESANTTPDFSSFLDLTKNNEENNDDEPKVELF